MTCSSKIILSFLLTELKFHRTIGCFFEYQITVHPFRPKPDVLLLLIDESIKQICKNLIFFKFYRNRLKIHTEFCKRRQTLKSLMKKITLFPQMEEPSAKFGCHRPTIF